MVIKRRRSRSRPTQRLILWQRLFVLVTACMSSLASAAPSITANVPFDFGVLAVKANNSVSTLTLSSTGSVTFSGDVIPMGGAVQGEYQLSGFPPGVLLTFEWDDSNLSAGGAGLPELLQVTDYTNPTLMSDEFGEAVIPVGASLKTNGSTVMYGDAIYSGTVAVRVRYWSEAAGGYLTHNDSVTFRAELRSALNLVENQALSFGTIAAYADPLLNASMVLGVDGKISSVTNAGNARITPLFGAQAGVILLSGAAPNYGVTITSEAGSIFLTHAVGGDVARFIVADFVTLPSGADGRTNSVGDLEIRVGATLQTEATNNLYENGVYSGTYSLTVSY